MKTIKALVLVGAYVVLLTWADFTVVAPYFAYDGLGVVWPGIRGFLGILFLCVAPCVLLPVGLQRPSRVVVWWIYLVSYIPSILVCALSDQYTTNLKIVVLGALPWAMLALALSNRVSLRLAIPQRRVPPIMFWIVFAALGAVCYISILISTHGNFDIFRTMLAGNADVYDLRSNYKGATATNIVAQYAVGLLGYALDPYLMIYGLLKKRRLVFVAGAFGQVFLFAVTGLKGILASTVFLILMLILVRRRQIFGIYMTVSLGAVVGVAAILDALRHSFTLSSLVTRRLSLLPGQLTSLYVEYFSAHPKLYFSTGVLGKLTGAPQVLSSALQVGSYYFKADNDADANLWGEGFAQAGLAGLFGYTLLLIVLLWVYDSLSKEVDPIFAALMVAMPAYVLSNSSPLTMLLTHSGVVVALLVYLSPSFYADS